MSMKPILEALISTIQDNSGGTSSIRIVMFFVVACVMIPAAITAVKTGQPLAISKEDVALVLGVMAMKAHQRGKEAPEAPATSQFPNPTS